jgi:glycosyltransferase involved in cell wall biosynthesis
MVDAAHDVPPVRVRISVIIPCHDGECYVAETIRSVLAQDCPGLEIVVVDDGSTDRSAEVVQSFGHPVRYVHQAHGGAAVARNRGVELSTGAILGFLDADDLWPEGVLNRWIGILERHPSVGIVVGHMEQFVSPELSEAAEREFRFSSEPVLARMCGSVLVRRSEFVRVGGFSPQLTSGEFMDWCLRAEDLGVRSLTVSDVVLRRRLHRRNHGIVRRDARQDYVRVVKAALDRRRASAPGDPS